MGFRWDWRPEVLADAAAALRPGGLEPCIDHVEQMYCSHSPSSSTFVAQKRIVPWRCP